MNPVAQVLTQDRPCTWALREYARDLDTTLLAQRMALIDDWLTKLLKETLPITECK